MAKHLKSIPVMTLCLFIAALSLLVGTASAAAPEAAFSSDTTSGAAPLTVQFTDTSTGDPDGWAWFFGDETYNQTWTPLPNAGWSARWRHTSVVMPNGSIVLMGGVDAGYDRKNETWLSTDNGTTWKCVNTSSGWMAREGHTSVVLPDGSIVLMGGFDGAPNRKNDTWRSTDNGTTWKCVNESSGWTARDDHTSVVLPDGSIVLMGGFDGAVRNDTWRSTDGGKTWENITPPDGSPWTARHSHTSVALPDGSIILMGGYDGAWKNDVWQLADDGTTWTPLPNAGWTARKGHSNVAMPDGSIVLMGGFDGAVRNDTWRSTDNGTTWTQVNESVGWTAREGHTSVVLPDGSIVLMGGFDSATRNDVWRLETAGSYEQDPSHTYTTPGTYTVTLQAYNDYGYNATRQIGYITVTAAVAPTATFSANTTTGTAPLAVQFTDASAGDPTSWTWDFGDGATSTEQNPAHTYSAAGTYTVNLTVGNAVDTNMLSRSGYITVTEPEPTPTITATPTSRPVYSGGGGGGGSTGGPDGYNVGGDSVVSKVNVTGTGLKTFIVTGWKQSSPGSGIPPAPGTPYQYIDLVPARFENITGAVITFNVPAAWLDEHGFTPEEIVMYHYNGTAWEALPTAIESTGGSTVTFTATTHGFSLFAISGVEQTGEAVTTPTAAQTTAQATAKPTATQTTAAPPTGEPAPEFPLGTVAIVAGGILVLAAGGFLVRRWWIRRQNPALFMDYD